MTTKTELPKAKIKLRDFLTWLHQENTIDDLLESYIDCLEIGCEPYAKGEITTNAWLDGCYRNPNHIVNLNELKKLNLINYDEKGNINDENIFKQNLKIEWV